MMHMSYKQILALAALMVVGLVTSGCDSGGPEFIGGDTRVIEGILQTDEQGDTEFFVLTGSGTVNFQATSIAGRIADTGDPIADPLLGISIGAPNPADETVCQLTFSQVLSAGESFSVFYSEGIFCLTIFRPPPVVEGTEYDYLVTLEGAFS